MSKVLVSTNIRGKTSRTSVLGNMQTESFVGALSDVYVNSYCERVQSSRQIPKFRQNTLPSSSRFSEDGGSTFLRNYDTHLAINIISKLERLPQCMGTLRYKPSLASTGFRETPSRDGETGGWRRPSRIDGTHIPNMLHLIMAIWVITSCSFFSDNAEERAATIFRMTELVSSGYWIRKNRRAYYWDVCKSCGQSRDTERVEWMDCRNGFMQPLLYRSIPSTLPVTLTGHIPWTFLRKPQISFSQSLRHPTEIISPWILKQHVTPKRRNKLVFVKGVITENLGNIRRDSLGTSTLHFIRTVEKHSAAVCAVSCLAA